MAIFTPEEGYFTQNEDKILWKLLYHGYTNPHRSTDIDNLRKGLKNVSKKEIKEFIKKCEKIGWGVQIPKKQKHFYLNPKAYPEIKKYLEDKGFPVQFTRM